MFQSWGEWLRSHIKYLSTNCSIRATGSAPQRILYDGNEVYRRPGFCQGFSVENYTKLFTSLRDFPDRMLITRDVFSYFANRWLILLGYAVAFLVYLYKPSFLWPSGNSNAWAKVDLEQELLSALNIDVRGTNMPGWVAVDPKSSRAYHDQVREQVNNVRRCLESMLRVIARVVAEHPKESQPGNGAWQSGWSHPPPVHWCGQISTDLQSQMLNAIRTQPWLRESLREALKFLPTSEMKGIGKVVARYAKPSSGVDFFVSTPTSCG